MKNIILSFCILLISSGAIFAQRDPNALQLLDQMSAKYQKMSGFKANFDYTFENSSEGNNEKMSGENAVTGNKYKRNIGGQEIFNNGDVIWTYLDLDGVKEVTINYFEPSEEELTPSNIYTIYKEGYNYKLLPEKKEGAITYQYVELTPTSKSSPFKKVILQIEKDTKNLKSWKITDETGGTFSYIVNNFQPNLNLKDADFNFDVKKYPGVEVIDLR